MLKQILSRYTATIFSCLRLMVSIILDKDIIIRDGTFVLLVISNNQCGYYLLMVISNNFEK